MVDWQPHWYRLGDVESLGAQRACELTARGNRLVVHCLDGDVIAVRDGCPRCGAGLAGARVVGGGDALLCPGCGASVSTEADGDAASRRLPVMTVDGDVYAYLGDAGDDA